MTLKPSARGVDEPTWVKSSYSTNEPDGACVEVATHAHEPAILVRDSKDPEGPRLTFTADAWTHFVEFAATVTV